MKRVVVVAGLFLLVSSADAAGEGVVVIRSSELGPYKALEEAFTGAVGVPVKSLSLADPAAAKAAAGSGAVVVAIGQDAARLVLDSKPVGQVLFGLVPSPEKLGSAEAQKAVPMFAGPARQLGALRELLPGAKRLGVIYAASSEGLVADYERAARAVGGTLVKQEVKDRSQVANALRELIGKIDALLLLPDPVTLGVDIFKFLLTTSLESKVPLIGFSQGQAKAGALLTLEVDYQEMGREAAAAAKRALAGNAAAPQAPQGSLYVNGKTAQMLGVTPSPSFKAQLREVF
jgi:putative ABC transport system substrate-binding protein